MTIHRITYLAIILFVSVISVQAQQKAEVSKSAQGYFPDQQGSTADYSPSFGRLTLQFGSGVLFGAGGGVATGFAAGLATPDTQYEPISYLVNGFYLGYSAVSALGVYIVANSNTYNASFGNILLGHGVGTGVGLGVIAMMDSVDGYMGPAYIFALAAPIIGGIVANTMSIKKRNSGTSALLNIRDRQLSISSPSVRLTKVGEVSIADKLYSPTVKLLNISL